MNLPDSNVVWYNQRQLLLIRSEFSSWISFHVKRIFPNIEMKWRNLALMTDNILDLRLVVLHKYLMLSYLYQCKGAVHTDWWTELNRHSLSFFFYNDPSLFFHTNFVSVSYLSRKRSVLAGLYLKPDLWCHIVSWNKKNSVSSH